MAFIVDASLAAGWFLPDERPNRRRDRAWREVGRRRPRADPVLVRDAQLSRHGRRGAAAAREAAATMAQLDAGGNDPDCSDAGSGDALASRAGDQARTVRL